MILEVGNIRNFVSQLSSVNYLGGYIRQTTQWKMYSKSLREIYLKFIANVFAINQKKKCTDRNEKATKDINV